jgi:hypothetical protein
MIFDEFVFLKTGFVAKYYSWKIFSQNGEFTTTKTLLTTTQMI